MRRRQFSAALSSQHSGLSQKKYFRLFGLAVVEAVFVSAGQLYLMFASLRLTGLLPYKSWRYVHQSWDTINFVPMLQDGEVSEAFKTLSVLRWLSLFPALALFLFFGLTEDARSVYASFWQTLTGFGRRTQYVQKAAACNLRAGL